MNIEIINGSTREAMKKVNESRAKFYKDHQEVTRMLNEAMANITKAQENEQRISQQLDEIDRELDDLLRSLGMDDETEGEN